MSYDSSAYMGVDWAHWEATRSVVEYETRHQVAEKLEKLLLAAQVEKSEQFCAGVKASIAVALGVKVTDEVYPNQIQMFE
jgi:hypothetical protein